jgi:hypothetical protein
MPAKGSRKPDALTRRKKVSVTPALDRQIRERADACGMTEAKWMREVLAAAVVGAKTVPKPRRRPVDGELPHLLNQVVMQIRKLGTNVNQLAHQANLGLVAITRAEVQYLLNHHQLVVSKAMAVLERARG